MSSRKAATKTKTKELEVACDFSADSSNLKFSWVAGVYVWLGWFSMLPIIGATCCWAYFNNGTLFKIIISLIVVSVLYPNEEESRPRWGLKIGEWCMNSAKHYFGLKLCYEDRKAVQECGPGIFVIEPHDVMPLSLFCLSDCLGYNSGHKNIGCLTGLVFHVPFMKNIYSWASATSVDKKNILQLMDKGYSPTICPGGVQEVLYMDSTKDECVLYLKERKGVIRLALEKGFPITATFAFGQRNTYSFWLPSGGIFAWIGRKIGFVPMLFFGWLGIPFNIPKPVPLTVVVGKPIHVPKSEKNELGKFDDALVDKYHAMLMDSMRDIFENHKDEFEMGTTTLRII